LVGSLRGAAKVYVYKEVVIGLALGVAAGGVWKVREEPPPSPSSIFRNKKYQALNFFPLREVRVEGEGSKRCVGIGYAAERD